MDDVKNPAHEAAKAVESTLKPIPLPQVDTFTPKELSAAAAAYAVRVRKVQAATQAIEQLKAERMARDSRIAVIDAVLEQDDNQPAIDVWCASYSEGLSGTVATMEVPGDWRGDEKTSRTVVLYEGEDRQKTVAYEERSFNISPVGASSVATGDLVYAEGMSDASVAYNLAMEPGHLKWKPLWRYGTLTADAENDRCSLILLSPNPARRLAEDEQSDLPLDEVVTLSSVPIYYPPCHGRVFKKDDAVLVLFEGYARNQPKVIGFRREPKPCPRTWQGL